MVCGAVTVVTFPVRGLGPLRGQEETRLSHGDSQTHSGGRSLQLWTLPYPPPALRHRETGEEILLS